MLKAKVGFSKFFVSKIKDKNRAFNLSEQEEYKENRVNNVDQIIIDKNEIKLVDEFR